MVLIYLEGRPPSWGAWKRQPSYLNGSFFWRSERGVKTKKSGKNIKKIEDPNIAFVRNEIESKLGLNVEIVNKKNNSGKITIKYKSLEQFELISKKLRK